MKLIKAIGFVIQFGLIGLGLAVIYVIWQADYQPSDLLNSLTSNSSSQSLPRQRTTSGAVQSYADAVALSSDSVVTIYTSKTVDRKPHPLLDDPVFKEFFGDQLRRSQRNETETNLGSGVIVSNEV